MTLPTNEQLEAMPIIPIKGQSFSSEQDWINRATRCLTSHPQYRNTEHGGPAGGWRGPHFTTMCFDQLGRRVRNGGEFARAKKDSAYPVWWIWPDQIATLAAQHIADAKRIAELEMEIERLTTATAKPVVKFAQYSTGLCGCCGVQPIAYPIAGECIDCFSANEASHD